jgi:aminoglycoside phosphotransferase (APT) family kinase protein
MSILRARTTIPVPKVHAWGIAADNPLHLGPFIMMDYVCGESLQSILAPPNTRLMREDINDDDIQFIYKQMTNIFLQIFSLDFDHIGSLPPTKTSGTALERPLTWKVHDILQDGGVNTFGMMLSIYYILVSID